MAHTHTSLLTHIFFSTKDRFPSPENDMREELEKYVCGVASNIGVRTIAIKSVLARYEIEYNERYVWS